MGMIRARWVDGGTKREDMILCIAKDLLKPTNSLKYTTIFIILQERRAQKLKIQAQISKAYIFNNTPDHELGSPKLFEDELVDPPSNSNFHIVLVCTGFLLSLYA